MDKHYGDRVLIAEANLWPEDACRVFWKRRRVSHVFNYPLMPRLFLGFAQKTGIQSLIFLTKLLLLLRNCQWALFLRNHDEIGGRGNGNGRRA